MVQWRCECETPRQAHLCAQAGGGLCGGEQGALLPVAAVLGGQCVVQAVGERIQAEQQLIHQTLKLLQVVTLGKKKSLKSRVLNLVKKEKTPQKTPLSNVDMLLRCGKSLTLLWAWLSVHFCLRWPMNTAALSLM